MVLRFEQSGSRLLTFNCHCLPHRGLTGDLSSGSSVLPGVPLGNLCAISVNDALVNFGPLGSFLGPDKLQVLSLVWICWETWVCRMSEHDWTSALS